MVERVPKLRKQLPELLGVRVIPAECDVRIGIATGEVLTGSIGSELMMSFTVMGDAVNLASRLEAVNKFYGCRILIAQATAAALGADLELREIDRLVVFGQSVPQAVFEVVAKRGELTGQQEALRSRYRRALPPIGLAAGTTRRPPSTRRSPCARAMARRSRCSAASTISDRIRRRPTGMGRGKWNTNSCELLRHHRQSK